MRVKQSLVFAVVVTVFGLGGAVACDTKGASASSPPGLVAQWTLEAAYVAPANGPESAGYITVHSGAERVAATFEVSLDDGESYEALPLLGTDADGASISGNTITELPAGEFVEIQWTTAGLARDAALTDMRLRAHLDDGTDTETVESPRFMLDNTASDNAEPVLELIHPDGHATSFTDTNMVPAMYEAVTEGTWEIRGSDPDYFDELELTVTFNESNSFFGAYGNDISDFFDLTEPQLSGTPPRATTTGRGSEGVVFELTRTLPDLAPTTIFELRFDVTLTDGEHTVQESLLFGHYVGAYKDYVFVLEASSSMGSTMVATSPVYGPNGNLISNPTAHQAAVSDIALKLDSLSANDRFDIVVRTGTSFTMWSGALVEATTANKQSAISYIYSVAPTGGQHMYPSLNHAFTYTPYGTADEIRFYNSGYPWDANQVQASFPGWFSTKPSTFRLEGYQYGGSALTSIMAWIDAQPQCDVYLR